MPCHVRRPLAQSYMLKTEKKTETAQNHSIHSGRNDLCWHSLLFKVWTFMLGLVYIEVVSQGVSVVRHMEIENWHPHHQKTTKLTLQHWRLYRNQGGPYPPFKQRIIQHQQLATWATSRTPSRCWLHPIIESGTKSPKKIRSQISRWLFFNSKNTLGSSIIHLEENNQIHKSQISGDSSQPTQKSRQKGQNAGRFSKAKKGGLVKIKSLDLSNHLAAIPKHMTSWCLLVWLQKKIRFTNHS